MKSKTIVRFTKISLLDESSNKAKKNFIDGIKATITIDSKTNLIYEFPAPSKKLDKNYFASVPHEIKTNFKEHLEAFLKGFESLDGSPIENILSSPAQIDTLKSSGIHTLEALLESDDRQLADVDLDIATLKYKASAFLENKSLEEQKIAELEEKYATLEKMYFELSEKKETVA